MATFTLQSSKQETSPTNQNLRFEEMRLHYKSRLLQHQQFSSNCYLLFSCWTHTRTIIARIETSWCKASWLNFVDGVTSILGCQILLPIFKFCSAKHNLLDSDKAVRWDITQEWEAVLLCLLFLFLFLFLKVVLVFDLQPSHQMA